MRADLGNTSGGAAHGWLEIGLKRPFATIQVFGGWTSLMNVLKSVGHGSPAVPNAICLFGAGSTLSYQYTDRTCFEAQDLDCT